MQQYRADVERRRRNIRLILGTIIVLTLPFYCAGIILWGTAPRQGALPTQPQRPTNTAIVPPALGSPSPTIPGQATITPLPITIGPQPTAILPPTSAPTIPLPTRILSPTPTFPPTATFPPPPTPLPTQPPPTAIPTEFTPLPFDTLSP